MASPSNSPRSRVLAGILAFALAFVAVAVALTWCSGSSAWPLSETAITRKLGTDPALIEAAVGKGDSNADLRIGIVGDIQNGVSELGALLDSFRGDRIDFLLQLGDAANEGEPGRYAVLRDAFAGHVPGVPVLAVPGNHDIEPDQTTRVWEEWVGPAQWRIDVRGWRILGIDDASGEISPASTELLRKAAADPPPECGTIVVAHRPLGAEKASDGVGRRTRQLAATGLVPAMTLAGHWHANDTYADEAGTVHHLLGENCDRSSSGDDRSLSRAVLVLHGPRKTHTMEMTRIERRATLSGEFMRLAVGRAYPVLRAQPALTLLSIVIALAGAAWFSRVALRQDAPPHL